MLIIKTCGLQALQDGELLLRIAESVLPEVAAEMKAVHTKESWYEGWNEVGMAKAVENIHIFLSICRAVGVSEHYHFSASDLIKVMIRTTLCQSAEVLSLVRLHTARLSSYLILFEFSSSVTHYLCHCSS